MPAGDCPPVRGAFEPRRNWVNEFPPAKIGSGVSDGRAFPHRNEIVQENEICRPLA
jgi:hypothetical protein